MPAELHGQFPSMAMRDYHAAEGVSKTALDYLKSSPQEYFEYVSGRLVEEKTDAMMFGSLLHSAVLEHETKFVIRPLVVAGQRWNGNATVCKEWVAAQTLPILTPEQGRMISESELAIRRDPLARGLLETGEPELSLFAKDPATSLLLKARPDWTGPDYFVDIKTTTDASTEAFSGEIYRRRYHVQAALYLRVAALLGMPQNKWYFIALQKSDPPRLNVRELHESAIDLGKCELDDDLRLLLDCLQSDNWPGYSGGTGKIEKIDVPQWAHARYTNQQLEGATLA